MENSKNQGSQNTRNGDMDQATKDKKMSNQQGNANSRQDNRMNEDDDDSTSRGGARSDNDSTGNNRNDSKGGSR